MEKTQVRATVTQTSPRGGRPGRSFYLTESEALFITAKSETPKANALTRKVIDVFVAVRRGLLRAPVAPLQRVTLRVGVTPSVMRGLNGLVRGTAHSPGDAASMLLTAEMLRHHVVGR